MKNIFLTALICLCTYHIQAQSNTKTTTTQAAAKTPDTTKQVISKHIKTRIIGGGQMVSNEDIMANIIKSNDHTTFTNSIVVNSLAETLKTRGPFTVFAPTNAAFQKLPQGTLDTLTKPAHSTDLTRLLTYHVISGRLTSKDIAKQIADGKGEATFTTLTGNKLKAQINSDRNIVLVDEKGNQAVISQFDIEQSNGILDVVNSVLIPKGK